MTWTALEIDLMTSLTCKVRVLSTQQIINAWKQEHSTETLAFSVRRLNAARLIRVENWTVVLPKVSSKPLFTWKPGQQQPDTWPLSKEARSRWNRPASTIEVFQATNLAGRVFGSRSGHKIREIERRHDLLLSEVFVLYRLGLPKLADCWIGEDALPIAERGVKNPDAFLVDEQYQPRRVIESAGSYSQKQMDTFHEYCRQCRLPYELW